MHVGMVQSEVSALEAEATLEVTYLMYPVGIVQTISQERDKEEVVVAQEAAVVINHMVLVQVEVLVVEEMPVETLGIVLVIMRGASVVEAVVKVKAKVVKVQEEVALNNIVVGTVVTLVPIQEPSVAQTVEEG
jgi:hypothetical protein